MSVDLFKLYDTHGLPLSISLMCSKEYGVEPDIAGFIRSAWFKGWSYKKTMRTVREALREANW